MLECYAIGPDRLDEFIGLARRLNGGNSRWIAPLFQPLFAELSGTDAFGTYGRQQLFLCENNGRVAGRIGAITNPRLVDVAGAVVGQLGYFECEDNADVARALIDAAGDWLAAQGAGSMLGPICGGTHRLHRFLIDGFDTEPFLFEPRNPPHYPRLFEAAGFEIAHQWASYEFTQHQLDRVRTIMEAIARRTPDRYRIDLPDPSDPMPVLARIHPILDSLWTGHLGYAFLDLVEFAEAYGGLLAIMDQGHLGVLHDAASDADVGCALYYPDYADEVRALDGDASGWAAWKGAAPVRRYILHTVALAPEARNTGAAAGFIRQALTDIDRHGARPFMAGLVTEDMTFFSRLAKATRRYAMFSRGM